MDDGEATVDPLIDESVETFFSSYIGISVSKWMRGTSTR
jgi:hypothetical protein